jgi:hypothetical protein
MSTNHLEQLIAEWYEYSGYFVRRNVKVGKRKKGGYECELDIVAFHPKNKSLLHIEPSLDADSWPQREQRYLKKFAAGKKHVHGLFHGFEPLPEITHVAVFMFGHPPKGDFAGGTAKTAYDVLAEIIEGLKDKRLESAAVPEGFPLLRTIQLMLQHQRRAKKGKH